MMSKTMNVKANKMIRVCVVNPNYYRSSGVTVAIKRIFQGSEHLPIQWFFVDCKYGSENELDNGIWLDGAEVVTISLMTYSPAKLINAMVKLYHFLKKNEIQILHVHHRRLCIIAGWVAKLLNITIVYTSNSIYDNNIIFKLAPHFHPVAISNSVKENILDNTNYTVDDITIISNPGLFKTAPSKIIGNQVKTVGCIARLESVKNHKNLLQAWAKIKPSKKGYNLLLIGEGKLRNSLQMLVEELQIKDTVHFLGFQSAVEKTIEKCNFMVLSSWVEGHPLVVMEAAGLKRATLVTDVDGSRDCVPPDASLPNKIDPQSPEEISEALEIWLESPVKVSEEGEKYYNYWANRVSPSAVAENYYELYRQSIVH